MVSSFGYINDTLGRRTARSDYYINRGSTEANTFGYNTFSEVTNAQMGTNTYSYAYDPIGNRLQSTVDSGQLSETNAYAANGLNQYTNILNSQLSLINSHDADGNLISNGSWVYTWDAENRLLTASNLTTAVVCNFTYDHQSRRISKSTLTPSTPSNSLTSKFIYDGWNLICEQTSINNSSFTPHNSSFYTWGLNLSGSLQGAGGVGGLLCETKVTDSGINTYYALADANGNIAEYLDDSGNVVAHYEYDAFGNTSASSGDMVDDFVFRFSSKYLDSETGLYYYGYRFYSLELGRFLNRDPLGDNAFLQLYMQGKKQEERRRLRANSQNPIYLFVRNDPTGTFDILGLDNPGCDLPDDYKKNTDNSDCYLRCCATHDECYDKHDCTKNLGAET